MATQLLRATPRLNAPRTATNGHTFSTRSGGTVSTRRHQSQSSRAPRLADDLHQPPEKGAQGPSKLPWPDYFRVRKSKRNWEMATTIPTSLVGFGVGGAYFGSLESTGPIFGMDPLIVYGAATMGCMGLGWLLGPFIGGGFWRLSHRKALSSIEERDAEFYHHLVKHRADASRQSVQNPVPDYYGEKIGSLRDYRRWLRDQGKFNRKVMLPEE